MITIGARAKSSSIQRILLVTREEATQGELVDSLRSKGEFQLRTCSTFSEAMRTCDEIRTDIVLIDFMSADATNDPQALLHLLATKHQCVRVFGLGDGSYETNWATLADAVVRARFKSCAELHDQASVVLTAVPAPERNLSLAPWKIQAGPIHYVNHTPEMNQMLDHLVMMATHDVTLLLVGETGTGKTTLARMIHELSPRRSEPFQSAACGSFASDQIEAELFGCHRADSLTNDRPRVGRFEAAAGGSLLLDEIDVLSPPLQTKLLRVIETNEFQPVGSDCIQRSLARLIVASNVNLKSLMEKSEFRADLYYRLNVLEFHLLPLRQRLRDIVPLTLGFIDEFQSSHGSMITRVHPEFLECLRIHDWPGNIRELKNHVRRAVLFCRNSELTPNDLAPNLLEAIRLKKSQDNRRRAPASLFEQVASSELEILQDALRAHGFKRTATAQALGISRVGLYKKMKKHGLLGLPRHVSDEVASRDDQRQT